MGDIQDCTNLYIYTECVDFHRLNSLCIMEFSKFNELLFKENGMKIVFIAKTAAFQAAKAFIKNPEWLTFNSLFHEDIESLYFYNYSIPDRKSVV